MLYDPTWEKQTKADPFSLGSLIAWLEKQPEDGRYDYVCNGHCLLSQYFTAAGFENVFMYPRGFTHGPKPHPVMGGDYAEEAGLMTRIPCSFNEIAIHNPLTFGGALARARAAV